MTDPVIQRRLGLDGGIAHQAEESMGIKGYLKQLIHPEAFMVQMVKPQKQCETGKKHDTHKVLAPSGELPDTI